MDAPPVLACADAQAISKFCDGVIFNVAMRDVKKKDACVAVANMRLVGARIIGINTTKCDRKDRSGYYYRGYYEDRPSEAKKEAKKEA